MKFLIGIYQDQERINKHLDSLGVKYRTVMEVGPFISNHQAVRWMDYMEERLKPYAIERYNLGYLVPKTWYGATFETD